VNEPQYKPITGMINVNDIQEIIENNRYYQEEIERLNNIIKEVREYINKISSEPNVFGHYAIDGDCKKWLLEILDKEKE